MLASSRLMMVIGSALLAWFTYLQWFYFYVKNLPSFPYLMALALFSMFLMFLKNIRRGEVGHLELFGADMGTEVQQGWYWPPSFAPFLQGIDLTFGFDVVSERFSTLGSIGGNPNVYHYHEQRLPSYNVRVNSDSFMRANLDRGMNLLVASIFSIRDTEGRVKYYKVGTILYVTCWIFAFFGNFSNHATQVTNQIVNTTSSVLQKGLGVPIATPQDTRFSSQLRAGIPPGLVDWNFYTPTREKGTRNFVRVAGDLRKYFLYRELPNEKSDTLLVKESSCMVIPSGRKIYFMTKFPPTYTVDMEPNVAYFRKKFGFTLTRYFDQILLETTIAPWAYVRENWTEVETERHSILAQALASWEIQGSSGGKVCF